LTAQFSQRGIYYYEQLKFNNFQDHICFQELSSKCKNGNFYQWLSRTLIWQLFLLSGETSRQVCNSYKHRESVR